MKYTEKFKDPRWQKKRLDILSRDDFTCRMCYDGSSTLHAHHLYYVSGRDPWEYPDHSIITLCEECHKEEHSRIESIIDNLSRIVGNVGYLESLDDVIASTLIYSKCGTPPNISDVASRLSLYAEKECNLGDLLIFLQSKIDEATNG